MFRHEPTEEISFNTALSTREDFLCAVKDLSAEDAWKRFYALYAPFIYDIARKRGLNEADGKEIIQEVFFDLTRKLPAFEYDPSKQSFRGWLGTLTRWRVVDLLRKRRKNELGGVIVEPVAVSEFEALWDEEWKTVLLDEAMRRLEQQIDPAILQIYLMAKRKGPSETARILKKTLPAVYDATHKVKMGLEQEIESLRKTFW